MVTRYDIRGWTSKPVISENGTWVAYTLYQSLEVENAKLREKIELQEVALNDLCVSLNEEREEIRDLRLTSFARASKIAQQEARLENFNREIDRLNRDLNEYRGFGRVKGD